MVTSSRGSQQYVPGRSERRIGSRAVIEEDRRWAKPAALGGIGVAVLAGIVWVIAVRIGDSRAAARHAADVQAGSVAAKALAEKLKPLAQEYLDFKKTLTAGSWQSRRLDRATLALPAGLAVEDVLILQGSTLVASLSGNPRKMGGAPERSPESGVEVHFGKYVSGTGVAMDSLQFRAQIDLPAAGDKLCVYLVVKVSSK